MALMLLIYIFQAQLICQIKVFGEYSKATKHLFRLLYKPEEYKGRCLTGCKANSKYAQRPALEDQGKLKMIYGKFSNHHTDCLKKKMSCISKLFKTKTDIATELAFLVML